MPWAADVMYSMAEHNRLLELQWLHTEQGCQLPAYITAYAAESGIIDMLEWLKEAGCVFNEDTMYSAADHGQVVRYLRTEGCPWVDRACLAALRRGHRDLFLWALEHEFDIDCGEFRHISWDAVVDTDSLEMMTWFEQLQLIEPDSLDLEYAIQTGKLEMCRYFHAKGCGQDDHTESSAVNSGSPEVCDWLLEVNFTMNTKLLAEQAALLGKLAVLQWALQHGAQLNTVLLGCAVESGCLEVFQYLVSQGCEWNVHNVCFYAALGGSVDVLTFVFDQLQHDEVITEPALLTDMLNAAGAKEQLEAAKWLRQRGAEWPAVLCVVLPFDAGEKQAHKWRNATLRWARAEGCTSPTA